MYLDVPVKEPDLVVHEHQGLNARNGQVRQRLLLMVCMEGKKSTSSELVK
jgi:hypothetical protein